MFNTTVHQLRFTASENLQGERSATTVSLNYLTLILVAGHSKALNIRYPRYEDSQVSIESIFFMTLWVPCNILYWRP